MNRKYRTEDRKQKSDAMGVARFGDGRMKGDNIAERLLTFAGRVIRLLQTLPRTENGRHVSTQLFRSSTGGGSNYEEARAAESRADFAHKAGVAAKEMREAWYWLQIVEQAGWITASKTDEMGREANQLIAILMASARTARRGNQRTESKEQETEDRNREGTKGTE